MADMNFNTKEGATVARNLLILYLNTGTSEAPVWSVIGKRVEDSSMEYDWGDETKTDILGDTYTSLKTPTITQTFDPCELDASDKAQLRLWNQSIKDHDVASMSNNDVLVVHAYTGDAESGAFAERYMSSTVRPTSLGGSSNIGMPIDVTFGGKRQTGKATSTGGTVTFTAE